MEVGTVQGDYKQLIERLKLPGNAELYREYGLYPSDPKEGNTLWSQINVLHSMYEKLQTTTGDEAFLLKTTMQLHIRKVHELLDKLGWHKEE